MIKSKTYQKHYQTFQKYYTSPGQERVLTYLFPAPTQNHGKIIELIFKEAGLRLKALPIEDATAQQIGKSYVNRGQCVPIIYLTGNLIKYLNMLRKNGMSNKEIVSNYAFLMVKTSGGACRLPMYEEEYRKALNAVGLSELVIEIIDLGLSRKNTHTSFPINRELYIRLFDAIMLGDILNDIERRIRPYEVNAGETDAVIARTIDMIGESYRFGKIKPLLRCLKKASQTICSIPIRIKEIRPKVYIIGEFYVASTDGHCTGNMFRWLESVGAEVAVRPVTIYLLHKLWRKNWTRKELFFSQKNKTVANCIAYIRKLISSRLIYRTLTSRYRTYSRCLGGFAFSLQNINYLEKITSNLYHKAFSSGEGFMEIAEHIHTIRKNKADMILSLKPFTCMPSVCSDAIQSKVENTEQNSIFLSLEIDGDGIVNIRSRIEMKLFAARSKINSELADFCESKNVRLSSVPKILGRLQMPADQMLKGRHQYASTALNLLASRIK